MPLLPQWFKDFALCFSLSNLCYSRSWAAIQEVHGTSVDYYAGGQYSLEIESLTIVNVLLLTGIFRLLLEIVRDSRSRAVRFVAGAFLVGAFAAAAPQVITAICLSNAELITALFSHLNPRTLPFLVIPPFALLLVLAIGWYRITAKAANLFAMFMFPQAIANVLHVAWWFLAASPAYANADRPRTEHSPPHHPVSATRVVWIVFDEFDQSLTFEKRPAGLKLDEIDRFRSMSVHANAARSPSMDTRESLPSLIGAKMVARAAPFGPSELMLRYEGESRFVPWSQQANIFRTAHELGYRTALVGWYHPYCRVLGNDLDSCTWHGIRGLGPGYQWKMYTESLGLLGALADQFSRELMLNDLLEDKPARRERVRTVLDARARALALVSDARFGMIFLHLPIPRPPAVYDRKTRSFVSEGEQSYADNLQGVNDVLKDLRTALESAGLWDRSVILISSDHPLRVNRETGGKTQPYVPFLLKMANQRAGIAYGEEFNTAVSARLIEQILRGNTTSGEEARDFIAAHRNPVIP